MEKQTANIRHQRSGTFPAMATLPDAQLSNIVMIPGIGGSGEDHWQTLWERMDKKINRIQPSSWDHPDLDDWLAALDRTLATMPEPPILVAHSLGCLLVAHWSQRASAPVKGAFLVAVPDPYCANFPPKAAGFEKAPLTALPFASLVVASANDPYGGVGYARYCALSWNAGFVVAGSLGHINAKSGVGGWDQGRALFEAFSAGLGRPLNAYRYLT